MEKKETVSILGCGWYGLPVAKALIEAGHEVKGSTTSMPKLEQLKALGVEPYLINLVDQDTRWPSDFFSSDILLISLPPKLKTDSAANYVSQLQRVLEQAEKAAIKQLIFISSTGIYQDGNFVVTENDKPEPDTDSGQSLAAAESLINACTFATATIIRFAGLIGPARNLAKHFAGKSNIANGLAPINLIHLTDCVGLTLAIIQKQAYGHCYHGVSPSHPTREAFYTQACMAAGLDRPQFVAEKTRWKQIESKNVPEVLAYSYVFGVWDPYFKALST